MKPPEKETGPDPMQANIARSVGFHALRKMSRMAQDIEREELGKSRWAKVFTIALGALALAVIVLALLRPEIARGLLRSMTGLLR